MAMASDPDTSPAQTAGENSTYSVTTSDHNEKTDAVTSLSSSSERKRVVIVGAGLGGVVLAARLASLNKYDVLVFENNPGPGGRLSSIERSGFRFDLSGSSALLFPELIEAAFHDLGVEASDVLDLAPTGPSREFVFADGTRFAFTDDKEKLRATFESLEGKAGSRNPWSKFELFLKEGKGNYDAVTRNLLYADWSVSPLTALRPTLWPLLLRTRFVRSLSTFCERVNAYFKSAPLRQALATLPLFNIGQSPLSALGTYTLLPYGEFAQGYLYPRGGAQAVIEAFVKLATERGAKFQYNSKVSQINPNVKFPGRTTGVTLTSGEVVPADATVCNADATWSYVSLLPTSETTLGMMDLVFGTSTITFYWGMKRQLPELQEAHTVFLPDPNTSGAWEHVLNAVTKENGVDGKTPIFSVDALTRLDPSAAPDGKEGLVVTVPCGNLPSGSHGGIAKSGPHLLAIVGVLRTLIIERLASELGRSDFGSLIEVEDVYTPLMWQNNFNAWRGNTHGIQPSWLQSLYFRPPIQHEVYRDVFFTGASVQPGNIPPAIVAGTRTLAHKVDLFLQGSDTSFYREYWAAFLSLFAVLCLVAFIINLIPDEVDKEGFAKAVASDNAKETAKSLAKASASAAKSASRASVSASKIAASASKAAAKAAGVHTGWF